MRPHPPEIAPRSRLRYAAALTLVIAAGLLSRARFSSASWVVQFSRAYVGDALYAVAVFLLFALVWARARARTLGIGALTYCTVIEVSQLYDAPWANTIRAHPVGALMFGRGFLWSDLACYAIGVGAAIVVERKGARWLRGSTSALR